MIKEECFKELVDSVNALLESNQISIKEFNKARKDIDSLSEAGLLTAGLEEINKTVRLMKEFFINSYNVQVRINNDNIVIITDRLKAIEDKLELRGKRLTCLKRLNFKGDGNS